MVPGQWSLLVDCSRPATGAAGNGLWASAWRASARGSRQQEDRTLARALTIFAVLELKIVLAMLQRYRLELAPTPPIDRPETIVLTPKRGLPIIVHRRDRASDRAVRGVRGNVREMVELP